jgi:hypothetical protein
VYIKSHPKAPEPRPLIELHFSTTSQTLAAAKEDVENAVEEISGTYKIMKGPRNSASTN